MHIFTVPLHGIGFWRMKSNITQIKDINITLNSWIARYKVVIGMFDLCDLYTGNCVFSIP